MNFVKLTYEKLAIEAISELVVHDTCGAISLFAGTTRDNFEDKKVLSLEYEAYEPMAEKQMEKICNLIRERWPDVVNIAIYHRLGLVPVREASVVIAISSPHRRSSLDGVSVAIEELKKLVPIWKKEKYDGDESSWKENKESSKGERTKRLKTEFPSCAITEIETIPKNLIQIAANENEINRRIQCFVEKKREEIDLNNIMDFTSAKRPDDLCDDANEKESTCARTNSVIIKQEDSTCHLRVRRVKNRIGPQIRPDYLQTLDKLMALRKTEAVRVKEEPGEPEKEYKEFRDLSNLPYGLHNRLSDIEQHFDIKVINTNQVYERIKAIENRLMHLESVSPEYKHFLNEKITSSSVTPGFRNIKYDNMNSSLLRKIYNVNELDSMIDELKQSYTDDDEENSNDP